MTSKLDAIRQARDGEGLYDALCDFLIAEGGSAGQIYGFSPTEMEAVYTLAFTLYNQARWQDALRAFGFLCLHDHLDRRFHLGRGACLQMLKRHEEALPAYGVAFLLDATDPVVSFHIAECLIALGRRKDAIAALEAAREAAQDDPRHVDIARRAGALWALMQPRKEAA